MLARVTLQQVFGQTYSRQDIRPQLVDTLASTPALEEERFCAGTFGSDLGLESFDELMSFLYRARRVVKGLGSDIKFCDEQPDFDEKADFVPLLLG